MLKARKAVSSAPLAPYHFTLKLILRLQMFFEQLNYIRVVYTEALNCLQSRYAVSVPAATLVHCVDQLLGFHNTHVT